MRDVLIVVGGTLLLAIFVTFLLGIYMDAHPHKPGTWCSERTCERGKPHNVDADGTWDCFCLEQPK